MRVLNFSGLNLKPNFQNNFRKNNNTTQQTEAKSFYKYQSMVGLLNKPLVNSNNLSFEGQRGKRLTAEQRAQIIDMYKNTDTTQDEIAKKMGCDKNTVSMVLAKAGIKGKGRIDDEFIKKAAGLRQQNMTLKNIAQEMNSTITTVQRALAMAKAETKGGDRINNELEEQINLQISLTRMRNILKEATKEQILDMYQNQGMTKEEIMLYYIKTINEVLQDAETKED